MIRAMVLGFQDDPCTYNLQDQYMFGDAFLVAPVYRPVNKRTVYLPGRTWYDYETGKEYAGPVTLHVEPPLTVLPSTSERIRSFPWGGLRTWEKSPSNPITLDVWLSSEARCTLYDDDERARTEEIVECQARKREPGSPECWRFRKKVYREVQQDRPPQASEQKRQGRTACGVTRGAGEDRAGLVL